MTGLPPASNQGDHTAATNVAGSEQRSNESPVSVAARGPLTVVPATPEWGCAYGGCSEKARVVVTGPTGNQWGACTAHIKYVKEVLRDD